ncbi:MAG: hypothetical protein NT023_07970 [Armatimonadetes bacterium]|nr:hypothetical protein [Armatimonadota bacterium]
MPPNLQLQLDRGELLHALKSGLKDVVAEAEQKRDSLVGRAHSALAVFGITRAELRTLVDEKMRRTPRP